MYIHPHYVFFFSLSLSRLSLGNLLPEVHSCRIILSEEPRSRKQRDKIGGKTCSYLYSLFGRACVPLLLRARHDDMELSCLHQPVDTHPFFALHVHAIETRCIKYSIDRAWSNPLEGNNKPGWFFFCFGKNSDHELMTHDKFDGPGPPIEQREQHYGERRAVRVAFCSFGVNRTGVLHVLDSWMVPNFDPSRRSMIDGLCS